MIHPQTIPLCRRRPGGAVSPASGGRTRAASCGPRRLRRAEGRGSRPWASRRGLGSQRSPLAGGSALVWTAFRGRAFLSGPHSPHRLLCSMSQGAARRVLLWRSYISCLILELELVLARPWIQRPVALASRISSTTSYCLLKNVVRCFDW